MELDRSEKLLLSSMGKGSSTEVAAESLSSGLIYKEIKLFRTEVKQCKKQRGLAGNLLPLPGRWLHSRAKHTSQLQEFLCLSMYFSPRLGKFILCPPVQS